MKLLMARRGGRTFFGAADERGVLDVRAVWPEGPASVLAALEAGPLCREMLKELLRGEAERIPFSEVALLSPLPRPPKLIGLAVNYVEHHKEFHRGHSLPADPKARTTPRPFLMPSTCVLDPGALIPWPGFSRQIDYEVELAAVVGARCKDLTPEQAPACVAGYTVANDVSARSVTHAEGREKRPKDDFFDWLHGKWADGFCPLGPWVATADEVGDPRDLRLALWVNDEKRQDETTAAMIFDVYELVAFCSRLMTLEPGDVIATGTPSGVGFPQGKLLKPGDRVRCSIERVGELVNTMGPAPDDYYTPLK